MKNNTKKIEKVRFGRSKNVIFRELKGNEIVFREAKEFRDYLPPLTEQEFEALEEAIVRDGMVKNPLVVWHGKLLDGYSRFAIAQKHNLPYRAYELSVETEAEALAWLVEHHIARRHLTLFAIVEMYLKLKPVYAIIAKQNQGRKDGKYEPLHTLKKIADKSDCSKTYVHMVETILESKRPKLIHECRTGKKSISRGYYAIKETALPLPPNDAPAAFMNSDKWINEVIQGDVVAKMKELNTSLEGMITLILTSIPFNNRTVYGNKCNDDKDYKTEYLPWLAECIKQFALSLRPGGRLVIECDAVRDEQCKNGESFRRNIYADLCKIVEQVAPELKFFGDIVWYRYNPKHFTQTGTQLSCRAPRLARNHSYILIWSKGSDHTLTHFENSKSDILETEWKEMVDSLYDDINPDTHGKKKYGHPATWPEKLCDRLIRLLSYPDKKNIVLDPFGGVGTTAVAAYKAERSYISIDQNPDFCRTAVKRLAEAKAEVENDKKSAKSKAKYRTAA